MLWPVNPNIVTVNKLFQILPSCTGEVYNIAGYPEYSHDPKTLAPEQQKALSDLAQQIVNSWKTNSPIVAFMVVGHADVALRKPMSDRAAYEQDVSEKRADAARNALLTYIGNLPGGKAIVVKLNYRTRGEGSKYLMVRPSPTHALTESEMKMNRRVEIYPVRCLLPEPVPPDPNDTLENRIKRALSLLRSRGLPGAPEFRKNRAPCILNKLLKPGVVDTFVDGRAVSYTGVGKFPQISNEGRACFLCEWNGNYDTPASPLPETEVQKFLGRLLPVIQAGGFAPSSTDDNVLLVLNNVLERIDMGMNQVDLYLNSNSAYVNPLTGYGYSGDAVRRRLQKMYRDNLNDENNIYSCYK